MRLRATSTQQRRTATETTARATPPRQTSAKPAATTSSRERSRESSNKPEASPAPSNLSSSSASAVCYCGGERHLGDLEVNCAGCKRWFHQTCFRDLQNFGGMPFMVSYMFTCQNCSPDGHEKWSIKSATFSHMCVMAMANMALEYQQRQQQDNSAETVPHKFFSIEDEIIPYIESHWEYLSTTPRRQKKTWHQTVAKTLQKESELFEPDSANSDADDAARQAFALRERDLFRVGPMHEAILQLSKRHSTSSSATGATPTAAEKELLGLGAEAESLQTGALAALDLSGGPKTRGASKRKAAAALASGTPTTTPAASEVPKSAPATATTTNSSGAPVSKKSKQAAPSSEFSSIQVVGPDGQTNIGVYVDVPFNREGYRYYLVEKDPTIPNRDKFDTEEMSNTRAVQIPSHIYRLAIAPIVTLSSNDRAHQLILEQDNLTVTGFEGYSVVRASHSVSHGCWYYEMEFLAQPGDSHVRVGWAQSHAVLQASLGYSKFGYSWRSKHGTAFHDGYGKHFHDRGYRQGDIIGCLIELPSMEEAVAQGFAPSDVLPASHKDCDLIKFKQTYFFEEKADEPQQATQRLKPIRGSKIEFFLNGQSAGVAYEDIYFGHYFPAVSLFHSSRVRFNFGPHFKRTPDCVRTGRARPMCARLAPGELQVEQSLADMLHMCINAEELECRNTDYFDALAAKDEAAAAAAATKGPQRQQQQRGGAASASNATSATAAESSGSSDKNISAAS